MKAAFTLKIVFVLLLCFVVSFNLAEAERSIRLRKVKTHIAPRHISLSARSGNGVYARTYAYGRPMPSYTTKGKTATNRRYHAQRRRNGRRERLPRTYANKYRNWSPNANKNPRADKIGQLKRRKELLPFLVEPPYGPNKQKRRARPKRPSAMQRPKPPKKPDREHFDDDYFFPEEAKRAETKYEFETRYPRPKKKRRPDFEPNYKTPSSVPKIPYYDEKPLGYKTKPREPSFSYSSFVQHSSGSSDDADDFYEDPDSVYSQPVVRNKKKRVKKKSNSRKKNKDQFKPFVFENDHTAESYPPYVNPDDYDLPAKTYKKRNKPAYDSSSDDEFLPSKSYAQTPLQASNLFSTDADYNRNNPKTQQFSPSYSQTWSQASIVETTARPLQFPTDNGFQPQQYIPNNYSYNKDYSAVQKTKTVATNTQQSTYYSPPDNTYKTLSSTNYATHNLLSPAQSQPTPNYNTYSPTHNTHSPSNYNTLIPSNPNTHNPSNYNTQSSSTHNSHTPSNYNSLIPSNYNTQSSSTHNSHTPSTYSQPLPAGSSILTDVTIQKSVPIYDNTETFYNFNNNAYVNSQSSKYYNSDTSSSNYFDSDATQKYGTRLSTSATYNRNKLGDKTDSDSDFIKKHQNLYNNGLSGVPVQGDGYAKETLKKDYDIGYGDFQFDENPNT